MAPDRNPARYDNRYGQERYDQERNREERDFEPDPEAAPTTMPPRGREPLRAERPQAPAPRPKELVDVEPEILEDPW